MEWLPLALGAALLSFSFCSRSDLSATALMSATVTSGTSLLRTSALNSGFSPEVIKMTPTLSRAWSVVCCRQCRSSAALNAAGNALKAACPLKPASPSTSTKAGVVNRVWSTLVLNSSIILRDLLMYMTTVSCSPCLMVGILLTTEEAVGAASKSTSKILWMLAQTVMSTFMGLRPSNQSIMSPRRAFLTWVMNCWSVHSVPSL